MAAAAGVVGAGPPDDIPGLLFTSACLVAIDPPLSELPEQPAKPKTMRTAAPMQSDLLVILLLRGP